MPLEQPRYPPSVFSSSVVADYIIQFVRGEIDDPAVTLYDYQIEALRRISEWYGNQNSPDIGMVVLPTGCGKSDIAVLAPYVAKARRVLVLTPSVIISNQLTKHFTDPENACVFQRNIVIRDPTVASTTVLPSVLPVTKMTELTEAGGYPLVVVNAHKIGGGNDNRKIKIETIDANFFDFVIVDEAHHYPAKTWNRIVDHFAQKKKLFLTATPFYKGKPILTPGRYEMCFNMDREEAIQNRRIRRSVVDDNFALGSPAATETAFKVVQHLLIHDLMDPRDTGHKALVICSQKENHNSISEMLDAFEHLNANFSPLVAAFSGDQTKQERDVILSRFKVGELRVLITCGMLREGFDHKLVSVIAIYRNIQKSSRVFFNQIVGRAVRRCDEVDVVDAVIIAHPKFKQRENHDQLENLPDDLGDQVDELDDAADDVVVGEDSNS